MSPAHDQDEIDFRALIARNAPALGRLVRHYEASPEARRDLEQEVLVALWRARASFRGESSERTWVYRIAHNIAASHVAKAIRTRRDDALVVGRAAESSPQRLPDEVAADRSEIRRLSQRIRTLDLPSQQLVLLALEGCTTAEISTITGLSVTNVTTRLSRARRRLAQLAQEEEGNR